MKSVCGVCGVREVWVSWADQDAWADALEKTTDEIAKMIADGLLVFACDSCKAKDEGNDPAEFDRLARAILGLE